MMKTVNFAILGYGRVAPTHRDAILSLAPEARIAAVCDRDPAALDAAESDLQTTKGGVNLYSDLNDLLANPDIDVVSVCTPSGLHAEYGIAAARAGKHVLVEKPMDVTLPAAEALVQACAENQVHLFPVYQNRLNSTIRLLKAAVDKGRFGKIFAINSTVIWRRTQDYYDSAPWRGTRAMDGGAFMNQGIHFLDAMRHIGGEITDVQSTLATLGRSIECEDTGSALFRFKSGALGNLFVTMLGFNDREGSLTVIGEKGQVKIGGVALNTIEEWSFAEPDPGQDALARDSDYHTASVYGNGHKAFYRQTLDTLQSGTPPVDATPELDSLKILLKLYA
ncbi:MAG: Gfo/Idh/MocA family oxidoreductase [Verrucomicrobia bacterium]|nr:Gfo/Idh/MocA family oxidoreductase [Verrucomicrobiota bacterium]